MLAMAVELVQFISSAQQSLNTPGSGPVRGSPVRSVSSSPEGVKDERQVQLHAMLRLNVKIDFKAQLHGPDCFIR